jgi:acyl-CoA thioesterase I
MKIVMLFSVLFSFMSSALAVEKIVIIGDSVTEGYGVDQEYSYPALLEKLLNKETKKYKVINGGVSGSTTASALSRLKWFLKAKPKLVIIALGANDGLRGIKVRESSKNLEKAIVLALSKNLKVVLVGMKMPPNYGKKYQQSFEKIFAQLADKHKLKFIPFLLKGVAGNKELNIEDGIHPNRKGYKVIANNIYAQIKGLL